MPRRSLTVARRRACALALGALLAAPACTLGAPDGAQISTQGANGAPACVTCHGAKGEGNPSAGFPRLAGLGAKYLTEQLDAMADGGRVSPIMKATAQALDPAQRQAVAATTPPCPRLWIRTSSPRPRWAAPRGRHWRLAGHPRRLGQECPRLQPMPWSRRHRRRRQLPALAGQSAAYISGQLRAWRQGQRPPGPLGLMPAVATRLTDAEIDAVSAYYAGLPQAAEQLAAQAAAPGAKQ